MIHSQKMRIGFDARWYNDSGVGTYVAELLRALVSLQSESDFELVAYEDPRNPVPTLEGSSAMRIPVAAGKYSPFGQTALKRRARLDRLDLFHSPFYPIPVRISCPVVVTIHDLIPFLFRTSNPLKELIVKSGYRVAARSSHIITVSQHTANDVRQILRVPPKKITVIHNAVSDLHFHPLRNPAEPVYLAERFRIRSPYVAVGSAHNWQTKNLVSALRALVLAQQSGSKFQTVVYGPPDGFHAAGGRDAWRELDLVCTGHLSASDLGRLFRHAELALTPSLYEGFGLAILEAMSCGCAVITSNAGSLPEVAGQGAQKFDPLDLNGMANAATRLLSNPAELSMWQARALKRAADFSWNKAAQQTLSVYDRALRQGTGHRLQVTGKS